MRPRRSAAVVVSVLAFGGCGGEDRDRPAAEAPAGSAPQRSPLALPAGVPRTPTGRADPEATRTIRGWASALRAGRIERASGFWALPAKIQNGTPLLTLSSEDDVRTFNGSLSCGAVLTSAGAAGAYTIATFRLTERRGGSCGNGTGNRAQTAFLVRDGRIAGWYRLPTPEVGPVV